MLLSVLPYIITFGVRMCASNILIRKKDYEHIVVRGVFYGIGILAVILMLYNTMPVIEVEKVLRPRAEIRYRGWFLVFMVLNTLGYKQVMRFSITRKSTRIPSMFLAPRKNFIYTKYMEICFQQTCFVGTIIGLYTAVTNNTLYIATIMALIMMAAHIPMYWFINKHDATVITIGATVGGWLGTMLLVGQYNGFLLTLAIHITFYSVVLAMLGKYHRELHMLKSEVMKGS